MGKKIEVMHKENSEIMPKYSIVMPAYNCENTIVSAIESVLAQIYQNFELVIINDGSVDSTGALCDKCAQKDCRIKVFHRENRGVAKTRKEGVEKALAEYILFIDSDDTYSADLLLEVDKTVKNNCVDLLEFGYFCGGNTIIPQYKGENKKDFLCNVFSNTILDGTSAVVMWNKVYKKELLLRVDDWGSIILEDYLLNMKYYNFVNSYVAIEKPLYNYKIVSGSLSRSFNKNVFPEILRIHDLKKQFIISEPILSENADDNLKKSFAWLIRYINGYVLTAFIYKNGLTNQEKKDLVRQIYSNEEMVEATNALGVYNKYANLNVLLLDFHIKAIKTKIKMILSRIRRKING